jgi:hypothetical protein
MMRRVLLIVALACSLAAPAAAQPGASTPDGIADNLEAAADALQRADYDEAAALAGQVASMLDDIDKIDRAEAWRIYGLSLFFLKRNAEAEQAFLQYMLLSARQGNRAKLDPAQVPPEAVTYFDDVATRHEAEIDAAFPKPEKKKRWWFNALPMAGQFQNGHTTKAWLVGIGFVAFGATNLATYAVLNSRCDGVDDTCEGGAASARTLKAINYVSGALWIGVTAYYVVDGFIYYFSGRKRSPEERRDDMSFGVAPTSSGAYLSISGSF